MSTKIAILGPARNMLAHTALAEGKIAAVKDLAGTIHAHPTLSEIIMEAVG